MIVLLEAEPKEDLRGARLAGLPLCLSGIAPLLRKALTDKILSRM
jgi:hypothetical protein